MRVTAATYRKLLYLQHSEQRRQLDWLAYHVRRPLGDWQCKPNPHFVKHRKDTAHLTRALTTVTMPTEIQ